MYIWGGEGIGSRSGVCAVQVLYNNIVEGIYGV